MTLAIWYLMNMMFKDFQMFSYSFNLTWISNLLNNTTWMMFVCILTSVLKKSQPPICVGSSKSLSCLEPGHMTIPPQQGYHLSHKCNLVCVDLLRIPLYYHYNASQGH